MDLLWRMISAVKTSQDSTTRAAAEDAKRVLTAVLGRIDWQYLALDRNNRTPPPGPTTLDEWRRQVAEQVVKLAGPKSFAF